ncbi:hypothetical protein [uncultured Zoogloea sp.]|uniref:hypothetical protein n=1 Tax=uncultured Zoogloea sp. TaxID=160237 RepID=UPI002628098F|nr:hypothetical protein [uncultured Zoogloea sp.]
MQALSEEDRSGPMAEADPRLNVATAALRALFPRKVWVLLVDRADADGLDCLTNLSQAEIDALAGILREAAVSAENLAAGSLADRAPGPSGPAPR